MAMLRSSNVLTRVATTFRDACSRRRGFAGSIVVEGLNLLPQHVKQSQLEHATAETRMLLQMNNLPDRVVKLHGREFIIQQNIFGPDVFGSSEASVRCCEALGLFIPGKSFLDMGSGCGAISVFAALKGCSVTAVDIEHKAVENTLLNAEKHGVKVTAKHSDLFAACEGETYDVIFWNYPGGCRWFLGDKKDLPPNSQVIGDPGHALLRKFLTDAVRHVKPGGRIITGYEHFGDPDQKEEFESILHDLGLAAKRLFQTEDRAVEFSYTMSFYEYGWLKPAGGPK